MTDSAICSPAVRCRADGRGKTDGAGHGPVPVSPVCNQAGNTLVVRLPAGRARPGGNLSGRQAAGGKTTDRQTAGHGRRGGSPADTRRPDGNAPNALPNGTNGRPARVRPAALTGSPDWLNAFCSALAAAGLGWPEVVADGRLHRFALPEDRHGEKTGWYCLFADGVPAGAFGSWREGEAHRWSARQADTLTAAERDALQRRLDRARQLREEARAREADDAAQSAARLWAAAGPANPAHPYLQAKGVDAFGLRQAGEALLVPMRDAAGRLRGVQRLLPDGGKRFVRGVAKAGLCHRIAGHGDTVYVCEGYATGASLHMATGHTVLVAFDAGNLESVARAAQARLPAGTLVIAADNDRHTRKPDGTPWNTGLEHARTAAAAVGAPVVFPNFASPDTPDTDFNDLHRLEGLHAVRQQAQRPASGLCLTDWDVRAFAGQARPQRWLVDQTLPLGVPCLLAAAGGTGKGLLLLDLGLAVAANAPLAEHASPVPPQPEDRAPDVPDPGDLRPQAERPACPESEHAQAGFTDPGFRDPRFWGAAPLSAGPEGLQPAAAEPPRAQPEGLEPGFAAPQFAQPGAPDCTGAGLSDGARAAFTQATTRQASAGQCVAEQDLAGQHLAGQHLAGQHTAKGAAFGGAAGARPAVARPVWLGHPVLEHGATVILAAEDSREAIHQRLCALDPDGSRRAAAAGRLFVVPLPSAGGPLPLAVAQAHGAFGVTPGFAALRRQLKALAGLRLLVIDPLACFVGLDINKDPQAGQYVQSVLAGLAAETGATVLVAHHMAKTGRDGKMNADTARDAIRGTTALVDGARCVVAIWPADETTQDARHAQHAGGDLFEAAVVKSNAPADRAVRLLQRQPSGLLVAVPRSRPAAGSCRPRLAELLAAAIAAAAQAGRPYTKSGQTGLYARRAELPEALRGLARNKLETLLQDTLDARAVVACVVGRGPARWLDAPGGPFASHAGAFDPDGPCAMSNRGGRPRTRAR